MSNVVLVATSYTGFLNSQKAVKEAFDNDKDFIIKNVTDRYYGKPCNKSDLLQATEYNCAQIYYGKNNAKVVCIYFK
jgi:hypothetical protein